MAPKRALYVSFLLSLSIAINCGSSNGNYIGTPYEDERYTFGAQQLPEKLQAEYYDMGGEGISYHDSDSVNSGSGALNPDDGSYLHTFRLNESPDISYTKGNGVDDHAYNFTEPELNQLYLGWTEAGEWTKYTVEVLESGVYEIGLMFTARHGGKISVSIDESSFGPWEIPSTYVAEDTTAWRQWHHWQFVPVLSDIWIEKGRHVITITTVETGQMNYDYLTIKLKES